MSDIEQKVNDLGTRVAVLEAECNHQKVRQGAHDDLFNVLLSRIRQLGDLVQGQYKDLHDEVDSVRKDMEDSLKEIKAFMLRNGWGMVVLLITTLLGILATLVTK